MTAPLTTHHSPLTTPARQYICPGESHAISRSVHLARMAAFYPKCGDCPFRGDSGQLPPKFAQRRTSGGHAPRRSLVTADGLRGIFINELGRGEAFALTAAFATLLWESRVESRESRVEGRRSEVGGRKSEVGSRRSEVDGRKSEVDGRRSEGGEPGTQYSVLSTQFSVLDHDQESTEHSLLRDHHLRAGTLNSQPSTLNSQPSTLNSQLSALNSSRPTVVVGYDQRPSSPELLAGVLDGLRQTGCGIIEAGPATTPYLWWNVVRSGAAGGVLITGAGCDPSWTGIDFVGPGGLPVGAEGGEPGGSATGGRSSESSTTHHSPLTTHLSQLSTLHSQLFLEQIESRSRQPLNRPTRSAGEFRTVRNWDAYEESVAVHFHALRPLRVVVGTGTTLLRRMLESLFRQLPCELIAVSLPMRSRQLDLTDDPDVHRAVDAIRASAAHVGVLIDDDAQTCAVLDEAGRLIPSANVSQLLARRILDDDPGAIIVSDADLPNPTRAAMFEALHFQRAAFGGGTSGRFWFREDGPVCDAFRTLAAILSALSCSDAECSDVLK